MAIGPTIDVSNLSIDALYDLYYAIARKDHVLRVRSQYGEAQPPVGHCVFRPLPRDMFAKRVAHYDTIMQGKVGRSLRVRLSRQATAYGISITTSTVTLQAA